MQNLTKKPSGLWAKLFVVHNIVTLLSFTLSFIMLFIKVNCDLLSLIIAWKSQKFRLKTAQNYIMNDIMNDSFAEKKKEPKAFNPLMARQ